MFLGFKKPALLAIVVSVALIGIAGACYAKEDAWLGVVLQPLSDELRDAMDLGPDVQGVLISDVVDESPAEEAGLQDGDVIVEIGDEAIASVKEAVEAVKAFEPGDDVDVVVIRDGDVRKVIGVELGERGEDRIVDLSRGLIPQLRNDLKWAGESQGFLGVEIHDMSADLADYFDVREDEGVLVLGVNDGSPAEKAGLRAGDVILEVDGTEVNDTGQLVKYIRQGEPGDRVDIKIKRKRRTETVEVTLGKTENPARVFVQQLREPGRYKRFMSPDDIRVPDLGNMKMYRMNEQDLQKQLQELKQDMKELKKEIEELRKS
jgi:S1-C subfamily serine protease